MQARWKFSVVDELPIFSTATLYAMLKTLAEQPPRQVLMLASTDP